MAFWAIAAKVAGSLFSAAASKKKAKEDKEDAKENTLASLGYSALKSQYDAQLDDYYTQLGKKRKERGLDQFRQFSTLNQFAPNYINTNRVVVGEMPSIADLLTKGKAVETLTSEAPTKKKGLLESISGFAPWDQAIGRATDKLFGTDKNKENAQAAADYLRQQEEAKKALGG